MLSPGLAKASEINEQTQYYTQQTRHYSDPNAGLFIIKRKDLESAKQSLARFNVINETSLGCKKSYIKLQVKMHYSLLSYICA